MVKVYMANIRSCIDFASVVYGPMMTGEQSEEVERLQRQCLKIIYGFHLSYATVLEMSGLERLSDRRKKASEKFARKCAASEQFGHWFPENSS